MTQSLQQLENAIKFYDTLWWIFVIMFIIIFISIVVIAVNVSKIAKVQTQPFQNKKPEYPDKVIELLQAIVSGEQHNNDEIKNLKAELELIRNGGSRAGVKSPETIRHEELVALISKQNELLQKILDTTSGEEKRKLMEEWKQASDIINAE